MWLAILYSLSLIQTICASSPQNIIVVVIDDLGWDDISLHGSSQIPTPNIDRLAKEGIVLENYYTQAICTPSRGSLMTGMYPVNLGLQHDILSAAQPWGLPTSFKIMPQYLREHGYRNHFVGKWHLGHFRSDYLPTRRGFDTHFGFRLSGGDYYSHWNGEPGINNTLYYGLDFWSNESPLKGFTGQYSTDLFNKRAINILETHNKSTPLFLYLAHQSVHSGIITQRLQVDRKYVEKFSASISDEKRRHFAGMVSVMDENIGAFMKAVEDNGFLDNTVVFFTNDNGGPCNGQLYSGSSNHPLRGCKVTLWEGGIRGTGIFWSPKLLKPGVFKGLAHISDVLPTLLTAAKIPVPNGLDGVSHWNNLLSGKKSERKGILHNIDPVWQTWAYRMGDYKLIKGQVANGRDDSWYPTTDARNLTRTIKCSTNKKKMCTGKIRACLYNIEEDPCEQNDIYDENPSIVKAIREKVMEHMRTMRPIENKRISSSANPALFDFIWRPWADYELGGLHMN